MKRKGNERRNNERITEYVFNEGKKLVKKGLQKEGEIREEKRRKKGEKNDQ